jgi:hypothetical protein
VLQQLRAARAQPGAAAHDGDSAAAATAGGAAGDTPLTPEAALASAGAVFASASLLALMRDAPTAARAAALAMVRDALQPWQPGTLVLALPSEPGAPPSAGAAAGDALAAALAELAAAWRAGAPELAAQAHALLLRLAAARSSRGACILAAGVALEAPWPLDAEEWPPLRDAAGVESARNCVDPDGDLDCDPAAAALADHAPPAPGAPAAVMLLAAAASFRPAPGAAERGAVDALLALLEACRADVAAAAACADVAAGAVALLAEELAPGRGRAPPSDAPRAPPSAASGRTSARAWRWRRSRRLAGLPAASTAMTSSSRPRCALRCAWEARRRRP